MGRRPDPIIVLKARAEARSILFYQWGIYDNLEDAIAPLRRYAIDSGIVDDIGAAAAMAIIYKAFDLPPDGDVTNNPRITVS
jgi:hypothetical protein